MYIPLSDDKHEMVRDSSKQHTGQRGHNSNPVATLPHAAVVFCMQPFNSSFYTTEVSRHHGIVYVQNFTKKLTTKRFTESFISVSGDKTTIDIL